MESGNSLEFLTLGHGARHEAVDFVLETFHGVIRTPLARAIDEIHVISARRVEDILMQCISGVDDRIRRSGIITDPDTGHSYVQIIPARTGTTCLIALVDPSKTLYVASLGDSEALLGIRTSLGEWEVQTLSSRHNAGNEVEADRFRAEHFNEPESIHEGRVLGLITLTRAIGDTLFKLPPIYTESVLSLATPPFHENHKVGELLASNLTPPYLSNRTEVGHAVLAPLEPTATPVLILCSDGLCDLYSRRLKTSDTPQHVRQCLIKLNIKGVPNLALDLLWDALGGDGGAKAASKIIRGMPGRRVDDTTVIVLPF